MRAGWRHRSDLTCCPAATPGRLHRPYRTTWPVTPLGNLNSPPTADGRASMMPRKLTHSLIHSLTTADGVYLRACHHIVRSYGFYRTPCAVAGPAQQGGPLFFRVCGRGHRGAGDSGFSVNGRGMIRRSTWLGPAVPTQLGPIWGPATIDHPIIILPPRGLQRLLPSL